MNRVRTATAEEVATSWVRAESQSERFGHMYADALDAQPDLAPVELLAVVRGWPCGGEYLEGLPPDIEWSLVNFDAVELRSLLYIDWEYWNDVSGGTRLATEAIARMGWTDDPIDDPTTVEPLIVVTDGCRSRIVVLEGHSRLTHFVLAGDALRSPVPAYLGTSPSIAGWWAF